MNKSQETPRTYLTIEIKDGLLSCVLYHEGAIQHVYNPHTRNLTIDNIVSFIGNHVDSLVFRGIQCEKAAELEREERQQGGGANSLMSRDKDNG